MQGMCSIMKDIYPQLYSAEFWCRKHIPTEYGRMVRGLKRFISICLMLMMLCAAASAETDRGDLSQRFGSETVLTHQETEYRQRKRMTNVLFMGLEKNEEEQTYETVMMIVLAIDDNRKLITPIMLDCTREIDSLSEEETRVTLGTVISSCEDVKEGALQTVEALNTMFPAATITDYIALDLAGLSLMDGKNDADYESRMRAIAGRYTDFSVGDMNKLLEELSPYLTTDMKSGAMMKVVDKTDRYERKSTLRLSMQVELNADGIAEDSRLTLWTDEVWLDTMIETFLEENSTPW